MPPILQSGMTPPPPRPMKRTGRNSGVINLSQWNALTSVGGGPLLSALVMSVVEHGTDKDTSVIWSYPAHRREAAWCSLLPVQQVSTALFLRAVFKRKRRVEVRHDYLLLKISSVSGFLLELAINSNFSLTGHFVGFATGDGRSVSQMCVLSLKLGFCHFLRPSM